MIKNKKSLSYVALLMSYMNIVNSVGGLFVAKSVSNSLAFTGIISSMGSILTILATIFIGMELDTRNKRTSLSVFSFLAALSMIPLFIVNHSYFLYTYILVDFVSGFFALISSLAFNGIIKDATNDETLEDVTNSIATFKSAGLILGFITIFIVTTLGLNILFLLKVYVVIGLLVAIVGQFIDSTSKENLSLDEKSYGISRLYNIFSEINNDGRIKYAILMNAVTTAMQISYNGLIIYFWNSVDSNYSKIWLLLIGYSVGLLGSMVVLKTKSSWIMGWLLATEVIVAMGYIANQNVYTLTALIAILMMGTVPIMAWSQRIRILHTSSNVQASHAAVTNLVSSGLEVVFSVFVAGIFQYLHATSYTLLFSAVVTILVFIHSKKVIERWKITKL